MCGFVLRGLLDLSFWWVKSIFAGCSIRQAGLSFEAMFEEVPILIRNSHLVNTLLCEIEEETPSETKYNFLDLSTRLSDSNIIYNSRNSNIIEHFYSSVVFDDVDCWWLCSVARQE